MIRKLLENYWEIILGFFFIFWLVADIFIRFEPLNHFPDDDSAVFLYIGRSILNGQLPYLDTWDHKGPLLYYIDAFGLSIFGLWGVWIVQYILTFAGFCTAYLSGKKLFGGIPTLFGIIVGYFLLDLFAAGNITEEYSAVFALFTFGLFCLYHHKSFQNLCLFGIGFLFMCTFLIRPNNIGFHSAIILALGIADIIHKDIYSLRLKIIWVFSGMLVVLIPFLIYFGFNHALGEFYDQAFRYNMFYIETSKANIDFSKFLKSPLTPFTYIVILSYGFILTKAIEILRKTKSLENTPIILLLLAFPIEFFLSNISGRGYDHYFLTWLPYLIMASAFLVNQILGYFLEIEKLKKLAVLFIFILYFLIKPPQQTFINYLEIGEHFLYNRANGIEQNHALVDFIHDNSTTQDKVLRWGFGRWLNYAIERDSPSKYLYQLAFVTPGYVTNEMVYEFSNDIKLSKPKFIIESINYFIPIDSKKMTSYDGYIHPEYYEIIKFIEENYVIVKLKFYSEGQNKEDRYIKVWMLNTSQGAFEIDD